MSRKELIQWIRQNEELYAEVNLSIFNTDELHFLKRQIIYYNKLKKMEKDFLFKEQFFFPNPYFI